MKTAMQELSELLVSRIEDADDELKNKLNFFLSWITIHGLKKEREQIVDAFDDGQANWDPKCRDYENGNHYYNSLY